MPVILPALQEPTDIVIQGEQIIAPPADPIWTPVALLPVMKGETQLEDLNGFPVPCHMIGQSDWYGILPRKIGPMVINGNTVEMLNIGIPKFVSPNIDPIQKWLNDPFPIDMTGMWFDLSADMLGAFEATNANIWPIPEPAGTPVVIIPRGAIFRSGLIKVNTAPILPPSFKQVMQEVFTDSTQKFLLTGTTRDSGGSPLGNCTIIIFKTSKLTQFGIDNPIETIITSDASGIFSFQINDNDTYQLSAYLSGIPDVAGVTINSLTPTSS